MTDERIRSLARRAQQGDVDARASLLQERLRAGALDPALLECAARMGDEAARRLFESPLPVDVATGVEMLPVALAARVGVACARRALTVWSAASPGDRDVPAFVTTLEAWLAGGPRPDDARVRAIVARAWEHARTPAPGPDLSALRAIVWAGNLARETIPAHAASAVREALDAMRDQAGALREELCRVVLPDEA